MAIISNIYGAVDPLLLVPTGALAREETLLSPALEERKSFRAPGYDDTEWKARDGTFPSLLSIKLMQPRSAALCVFPAVLRGP
jgi:hypothetical protein